MHSCPVCGNTPHECKEWRYCGKQGNQSICTSHCKNCEYNGEPGDIHHCRYYIGRSERINVQAIKIQISAKRKEAKALYKKSQWRVADQLIREAEKLENKIKEGNA